MLQRCFKFYLALWLICLQQRSSSLFASATRGELSSITASGHELFTQDTSGLLWWSTSTQLHRFDGHEHQSYNLPKELQTQALVQLLTLNQQQLWLASIGSTLAV